MEIGAHISSAGGLNNVIIRSKKWGAEVAQIFVSSPQIWKAGPLSRETLDDFKNKLRENNLPVFIHSIYLINLGSFNPYIASSSVNSLVDALIKGNEFGASGVITHIGSSKGKENSEVLKLVVKNIQSVLQNADVKTPLVLETSAGSGNIIGDTLPEIAAIINKVKSERLLVALDTAHLFASGYDIRTLEGQDSLLNEFENLIGLNKLKAIHINDTNVPLGGKVDRHAVLGKGLLGKETFLNILREPRLKNIPLILETPDLDAKSESVESLELLKRWRDE